MYNRMIVALLVLSISTISQVAGEQATIPQSLLDLQHNPSPYECAILSAHAYQDDLQQGDPVIWSDPHSQKVHRIYGWTVAHVLTEDENDALLSKAFTQLGLPYGYPLSWGCAMQYAIANKTRQRCLLLSCRS